MICRMKKQDIAQSQKSQDHAEFWNHVEQGCSICGNGRNQSPIELHPFQESILPPLEFKYQPGAITLSHIGSNIHFIPKSENILMIGDRSFYLDHFHFHGLAEHSLDDHYAAMELHFVHKSKAGAFAVVGVMVEHGTDQSDLQFLWQNLPQQANSSNELPCSFNPGNLIPNYEHYYHYIGSLTTPNYDEGLMWQVLGSGLTLSQANIDVFRNLFGKNARPVQPRNERTVYRSAP